MKHHLSKSTWKEGTHSGTLTVMPPDISRPDLHSPLPSARTPVPQTTSRQCYKLLHTPRLSDDSAVTTAPHTVNYSEDFESLDTNPTLYQSKYSDDFENKSVTASSRQQYSEDFEDGSSDIKANSHPSAKLVRHAPHIVSALETIKTSIAETLEGETGYSLDTFEDDSEVGLGAGNTSGRNSRLTWQYSEDFDEIVAVQTYSQSDDEVPSTHSDSSTGRRPVQLSSATSVVDSEPSYSVSSQDWSEKTSQAAQLTETNFLAKAMENLKQKHTYTSSNQARQQEITRPITKPYDKKEKKALSSFCSRMAQHINVDSEETEVASQQQTKESVKYRLLGLDPEECVQSHGVSHFAINKLKLENTRDKLEKMAKEHVHEPSKCESCRTLIEELEKDQFIKFQLHKANERMIEDKLNNKTNIDMASILLQKPVVLPGQIQTEVGHLSPLVIWNRLGDKKLESASTPASSIISSPKPLITRLCPHLQAELDTNDSTMISSITEHLNKVHEEAQHTKYEIQSELERLTQLDTKEFWNLYFQKLSGSCLHT